MQVLLRLLPIPARNFIIRLFFLFISVCYIFSPAAPANAAWVSQTLPTTNTLYGVYFVDINTGYAVGELGTVIKTVNGGNDWTLASPAGGVTLHDVYFTGVNIGWTVGDSGIYKTTTGAANWSAPTHAGISFNSVTFTQDATTGFAGAANGELYWTSDGGTSWQLHPSTFGGNPIVSIEFVDNLNGFLVTSASDSFASTDSGTTWTPLAAFPPPGIATVNDASWVGTQYGWIVGSGINREGVYTTDGGASWTLMTNVSEEYNAVHFTDPLNGWLVTSTGKVMVSGDGGQTWIQAPPPASGILYDVFVAPGGSIYTVGTPNSITAETSGTLGIIKQTWEIGGTAPLPSPASVPAGGKIVFLIYVKNITGTGIVSSFMDNLNSLAFQYEPGSLYMDNSLTDAATDLEIFTATDPAATGILQTDIIGAPDDFASACTGTSPCPGADTDTITFGNTPTNSNSNIILLGHRTVAFRFMVTIK